MASQARKGGVSLPGRRPGKQAKPEPSNILAKIANSDIISRGKQAATDAGLVAGKLLKSTGKAAWIVGTTFLVLVVPLIIEMDRDQQFTELELQQQTLLGAPPPPPPLPNPK